MVCLTDGSKLSAKGNSGAGVFVQKGNITALAEIQPCFKRKYTLYCISVLRGDCISVLIADRCQGDLLCQNQLNTGS